MTTRNHRECYGMLLPDLQHLNYNQPTDGKAFSVLVERIGLGAQRRQVSVKMENWHECVACPDHRSCYDLSMARLALQVALGLH